MKYLKRNLKFVSIESILDFDPSEVLNQIIEINPVLVYIG